MFAAHLHCMLMPGLNKHRCTSHALEPCLLSHVTSAAVALQSRHEEFEEKRRRQLQEEEEAARRAAEFKVGAMHGMLCEVAC